MFLHKYDFLVNSSSCLTLYKVVCSEISFQLPYLQICVLLLTITLFEIF